MKTQTSIRVKLSIGIKLLIGIKPSIGIQLLIGIKPSIGIQLSIGIKPSIRTKTLIDIVRITSKKQSSMKTLSAITEKTLEEVPSVCFSLLFLPL
ncbi:hypothetical protein MJO29_009474 [Puccinia striiformis f. sp. tritici]|nr:hypothetical protein MJO29_009474 [Puccinia striiformis f. sp. tritici]